MSRRTLIAVPCYNEAERLDRETWIEFASQNQDIGFVFVNDGSSDHTTDVLAKLCDEAPDALTNIELQANRGKAEAVRVGILVALEEDPNYIGYVDADLATPLTELKRFTRELDNNPELEIVLGSRMHLSGHQIRRPPHRRLLGILFSFLTNTFLRLPFHDTQCGAKMFRATDRIRDIFETPFESKWIFDVEILLRHSSLTGREQLTTGVYELPLNHWQEIDGSKLGLRAMIDILFDFIRIWWFKRRPFKPTMSKPKSYILQIAKTEGTSTPGGHMHQIAGTRQCN